MEIRRFSRMNMTIPVNYRIHLSEPSEESWTGQGVLNNLSQGGAFLTLEDAPPLAIGESGTFIISSISPSLDVPEGSHIIFNGLVRRIDPPAEGVTGFGVAVQLLSPMELVPKNQVHSGALVEIQRVSP